MPERNASGLRNPNNPNADSVTRNAREMTRSLGLQLHILNASTAPEIDAAFAGLVEQRIGMLLSAPDSFFFGPARPGRGAGRAPRGSGNLLRARIRCRRRLDELRNEYRRGVRRAGIYTGKILKGARPADLPVEQSTRFEFVINLKAAKALGLTTQTSCSRSPKR
jgi:putative ABC transport system substrate-binding protein